MKYTIANVSCGKDSLAMVEEHIKRGRQLDEVVMYDTGMEFQAIYDTWAKLTARLDEIGIKHTVLYPAYPFRWDMLERLVTRRDGSENGVVDEVPPEFVARTLEGKEITGETRDKLYRVMDKSIDKFLESEVGGEK